MEEEQKEKVILFISFSAGLAFAIVELIFAIFSGSQSSLMDAVYDGTELIFIALILFLTPLFHKPISEKHPYGFYQVESIFLIIKGFMMLSVTTGVLANVIQSLLNGGHLINGLHVSIFQLILGIGCVIIYMIMKKRNRSLSSPTVDAELLGWKLDIYYSLGMSFAFFGSTLLHMTSLSFIVPFFDQIVAILIVAFMLPENVIMLRDAINDVFLFSPDEDTMNEIKKITGDIMIPQEFTPEFYDITRTGRHLWISIYFSIRESSLNVQRYQNVALKVNEALDAKFENCTCELILLPEEEACTEIFSNVM